MPAPPESVFRSRALFFWGAGSPSASRLGGSLCVARADSSVGADSSAIPRQRASVTQAPIAGESAPTDRCVPPLLRSASLAGSGNHHLDISENFGNGELENAGV